MFASPRRVWRAFPAGRRRACNKKLLDRNTGLEQLFFFHPHHRFAALTPGGDIERALTRFAYRLAVQIVDKAKVVAFELAQTGLQA